MELVGIFIVIGIFAGLMLGISKTNSWADRDKRLKTDIEKKSLELKQFRNENAKLLEYLKSKDPEWAAIKKKNPEETAERHYLSKIEKETRL